MISIERIRDEPDLVREAMAKRGEDIPIERILDLDRARRSAIAEADGLRARRKEVSRHLGKTGERPPELIDEMKGVSDRIKDREGHIREAEEEIQSLLLDIPNPPAADVPLGEDETGNVVLRSLGEPPSFSFEPLPHWELGSASAS